MTLNKYSYQINRQGSLKHENVKSPRLADLGVLRTHQISSFKHGGESPPCPPLVGSSLSCLNFLLFVITVAEKTLLFHFSVLNIIYCSLSIVNFCVLVVDLLLL